MSLWKLATLLLTPFTLFSQVAFSTEHSAELIRCESRFAAAPDSEESALCFFEIGRKTGELSEAAARIQRLLARSPGHPWLSLNLGHLLSSSQEWEQATAAYRKAAVAFALQRNPRGEVLARSNLQQIFMRLGRVDDAGREAGRAERVAAASGDAVLIARSKMVRARHLFLLGQDLERAYLLLRQAETSAFPDGPYSLQRECLVWLGDVSLELGQPREAQGYFQRFAELTAREGDPFAEASARYSLARTFLDGAAETPRPGDKENAIFLVRQALAKADEAQNRTIQAKSHQLLGLLLSGEEARWHLDACLKVAGLDLIRDRSNCLKALGRHLAETDPRKGRELIQEALALSHRTRDSWGIALAWRQQMRASWVSASREQAIADSLATLEAIEALRDLQGGAASRVGLFSSWSDEYSWLSGRLLESWLSGRGKGDLDRAFEVIERKRARELLDALVADRTAPVQQARLEPLQKRRVPSFASLDQVHTALAPDEALLSFQIAPDRDVFGDFAGGSWVVVSTRGSTRAWRLRHDRVALRPAVELFNGLFARRDGSELGPAAGLYRELLADALGSLPPGVRRLVIVPDDALHQLPFATLRESAEGEPLIARYELSIVPSAVLWLHWREQRRAPAPAAVLALADPLPLGSLPFARREAQSAVRQLGGESLLRVGQEASEGFLKETDLRRFGVLHFATHVMLDDQHPERSAVLLTPAPASEDGLLQTREIAPLHLEGKIVIISSCRTASGTVLRGEGVMGLARAFFQAGAPTVVANLWPLRDDDGAALFERFYHHLAQGKSVAGALRAAQLDRIADGAPGYAWAGLLVLGEGNLVPMPGARPEPPVAPWVWAAAGGAVLLAAGAILVWIRRHRMKVKPVSFS